MAMFKIFMAGIVGVVMGLIWFISGLTGTDPDSPFSGGLWKGPLAFAVGVAALVISVKEMMRGNASVPNEIPENALEPTSDGPSEPN
jgi:hypothetical protein